MSSKEMQISEEEYYATLLSNPDYSDWNKCKDVVDFLYGIGANGNLSRNIKLNNKRGKLGFSKNGYIWSFFAPQGKEEL